MNKPKLKLVVSESRSFARVDFKKYQSQIDEAMSQGHKVAIIQYLHGTVQEKMGYDIAACLNVEECADFEKERWIPGVYDVEVVDYLKPCRAYLWNVSGRSRGLIVDIEDKEGVRSAEEAYNNKEYML